MDKFKYTERFLSFQGEGTHTGKNTLWLRWFLCNLECRGFNQPDPTNPASYNPVGNDKDLIDIKVLEDLPVFEYGCDSAYSVARKYEHLVHEDTVVDLATKLEDILKSDFNPSGKFSHPHSGEEVHMCFTGGEPMMRPSQRGTIALMKEFYNRDNLPRFVTVETNGTQKISREYVDFLEWFSDVTGNSGEWFWSFSPKLFNTSGETPEKAIKPEVVKSYQDAVANINSNGHLKFVVNGTKETWDELEGVVSEFRSAGVKYPVWIMPVGATKEQQEDGRAKEIVNEALRRGYHISGRLHCHLLGNGMNT